MLATAFYESDFDWEEHSLEQQAAWDATPILTNLAPSELPPQRTIWNGLYEMRGQGMFKPRRYILKAFPALQLALEQNSSIALLDCGSGNGASILPLLTHARCNALQITALDLSPSALGLLRKATADVASIATVEYDLTSLSPPPSLSANSFDFALLIFTLSAIPPELHERALGNCVGQLKPGSGKLLFRDYGWLDMVQTRCQQRVGEATVRKADGVCCTFFTLEYLRDLFKRTGLDCEEIKYCTVRNVNRRTGQVLKRVFIQAVGRAI